MKKRNNSGHNRNVSGTAEFIPDFTQKNILRRVTFRFAMNRDLFWRIMFYVSWGTVALWVLLKSIGVIKTPFWLEFGVPAAGVVISVFSLFTNLNDKITKLSVDFATLATKFEHFDKEVNQRFSTVTQQIGHLDDDLEFVKKRLA